MNLKTIAVIILSIAFAFFLAIGGFFALYKYHPTVLGLPPNPEDTLKPLPEPEILDTLHVEPRVEMSVDEYDSYQAQLIKNAILKHQNDYTLAQRAKAIDSLNIVLKRMNATRDSINRYKDSVNTGYAHSRSLADSLEKLNAMYRKIIAESESAKKSLAETEKRMNKKQDSLQAINLADYAKIYNNSNPKEVAKILEQLDERDAALILKKMQKKKAGKVLEAMLPENAAAIMLLGGK